MTAELSNLPEGAQPLRSSPERRRYLALWFPYLAANRLRRLEGKPLSGVRDEPPLVFVEKQRGALRLAGGDGRAAIAGLRPGLTLADARARIPSLRVADADPAADARCLAQLALWCDRFTPLVAIDPPDGLILDVTGVAHLAGGDAALHRAVAGGLRRLGFAARATLAATPDAARALARFGEATVVLPGMDEAFTRVLPVEALAFDPAVAGALRRAGLCTLGDLAARPSLLFSARFGEDLARRLARTLGQEDARIVPLRPLPDIVVTRQFAEPLGHREGLEATILGLAEEAARTLEARGEGGRFFELALFRSDGDVRRLAVETGRPVRHLAAVLRLLRERLDSLADPLDPGFGFDAVRLAVPLAEPLSPAQASLDGKALADDTLDALIDRLAVRLGRARVQRFHPRDTHHPVREARALPAQMSASGETALWRVPEQGEPPARPLQLFEPPQPVEALAEVPDGAPLRFRWRRVLHEVARAEGPERIAPEWWREPEAAVTRDYFRVEDTEGRRFWLFRRGLYGTETDGPRWYLHGLFA